MRLYSKGDNLGRARLKVSFKLGCFERKVSVKLEMVGEVSEDFLLAGVSSSTLAALLEERFWARAKSPCRRNSGFEICDFRTLGRLTLVEVDSGVG